MSTTEIITLVGALAGFLTGLAALINTHYVSRKSRAEAADTTVESALSLLEPYKKRVAELELRVSVLEQEMGVLVAERDRLRRERNVYLEGAQRLNHQVRSLGAAPVFVMEDEGV